MAQRTRRGCNNGDRELQIPPVKSTVVKEKYDVAKKSLNDVVASLDAQSVTFEEKWKKYADKCQLKYVSPKNVLLREAKTRKANARKALTDAKQKVANAMADEKDANEVLLKAETEADNANKTFEEAQKKADTHLKVKRAEFLKELENGKKIQKSMSEFVVRSNEEVHNYCEKMKELEDSDEEND